MTIRDLQRAIAEVGRIRIGAQVETRQGKKRPAKLEQFRLTSPDWRLIQKAAELYGGQPQRWTPDGRPQQFEVYTTSNAIQVIVPPSDMALTQDYELWSAGGCQRRCDGVTETISGGSCICAPFVDDGDARLCKIHTRLWVMLADMPGLGLWRLETSGWYAARELLGSVDVIKIAAGRGAVLPARLILEQRSIKRKDETVKHFAVPRLDPELTPNQLFAYVGAPELDRPRSLAAIEAPAPVEVVDGSASIEGPKVDNEQISEPEPPARGPRPPEPPARGPRPPEPRRAEEPPVERCYCGHPELAGQHYGSRSGQYCEIEPEPDEPEPTPAPEPAPKRRRRSNVTPVPEGGDPPSVAEQINSPSRYKRRAPDAPTAGIAPRTVAEAAGARLSDAAERTSAGAELAAAADNPRPVSRFGDPTREPGEPPVWPEPQSSGVGPSASVPIPDDHGNSPDAGPRTSDAGLTPGKAGERAGETGMPAPASDPYDENELDHYPLPPEPPDDEPPPRGREKVTGPQLTKLAMLRQAERYDDNPEGRAQWFAWLSAAVRRNITTNKDLYKDEASEVIDLLEEAQQQDQRRGQ